VIGFVGVGAYIAVSDRLEGSVDDSLAARAAEVTKAGSGSPTGRTGPDSDDDHESAFTRPTN